MSTGAPTAPYQVGGSCYYYDPEYPDFYLLASAPISVDSGSTLGNIVFNH